MLLENQNKQFSVGQIIYIILDNDDDISLPIPAVVTEEIVNKSFNGVKKVYNISLSADFKKKISLDKIKGEIFENIDEMENKLFERAKQSISDMIEKVKNKSNEISNALVRVNNESYEENDV